MEIDHSGRMQYKDYDEKRSDAWSYDSLEDLLRDIKFHVTTCAKGKSRVQGVTVKRHGIKCVCDECLRHA
jgi:hypothetical protein